MQLKIEIGYSFAITKSRSTIHKHSNQKIWTILITSTPMVWYFHLPKQALVMKIRHAYLDFEVNKINDPTINLNGSRTNTQTQWCTTRTKNTNWLNRINRTSRDLSHQSWVSTTTLKPKRCSLNGLSVMQSIKVLWFKREKGKIELKGWSIIWNWAKVIIRPRVKFK